MSKSLVDAETRYTLLEKLVLALAMASIKLRHYFESHKIHFMTNFPLQMVLNKPKLTGRMAKWAIRLSTYDIVYDAWTAIISQDLADFVADFSPSQPQQAEEEYRQVMTKAEIRSWSLYTDEASNVKGTGLGLILKSPQGDTIAYFICCEFKATNNEAQYEALIIGLTTAYDLDIKNIDVFCDSLLIVNHINGTYEAKDSKMATYLEVVRGLQRKFDTFNIQQVSRELNTQADALAGLGDVFKNFNATSIPIVHIMKHAMERMKVVGEDMEVLDIHNGNDEDGTWIKIYKGYLLHGQQPTSAHEARTLRMKASRFTVVDSVLFKKSASGVLKRCLN